MKKRAVFATLATVTLLSMPLDIVLATPRSSQVSSVEQTIPKTMPPGTIITYALSITLTDKNLMIHFLIYDIATGNVKEVAQVPMTAQYPLGAHRS
ncbi:hypothetical protein PP175_14975 [Aneurinibacillus sp. Ricciae_BoGa-3]|uniref:hypothetical protein n=1 Tax=Aneurinibacillus sp. Ricciae_BoGa-3 TaxID=3022697 RepID=UPI0023401EC3|nr:hypothetical protein [Aneurinibacillus sp. Ricciae_BoGa-3]WCK52730.1 hypothetical protein PP175_14975 [Aneurinibacillus sp. Ricciae_BoGa-3]